MVYKCPASHFQSTIVSLKARRPWRILRLSKLRRSDPAGCSRLKGNRISLPSLVRLLSGIDERSAFSLLRAEWPRDFTWTKQLGQQCRTPRTK